MLYLIPFLHQTTTFIVWRTAPNCCILFHFYIKPQLTTGQIYGFSGCILFHFYIKPQPDFVTESNTYVVSYSISTSNHNPSLFHCGVELLYLIPFLHQTTTRAAILNRHYWLYLIPFLHQTTTLAMLQLNRFRLYLIPFLHQTTTYGA